MHYFQKTFRSFHIIDEVVFQTVSTQGSTFSLRLLFDVRVGSFNIEKLNSKICSYRSLMVEQ